MKYHGVAIPIKVISHSATLGGRVIIRDKIANNAKATEGRYKNEATPIAIPTLNKVAFGWRLLLRLLIFDQTQIKIELMSNGGLITFHSGKKEVIKR